MRVIYLLFFGLLLSFTSVFALTCSITPAASCSDTIVMYVEGSDGTAQNAHVQNVSVGTYDHVLCCSSTDDDLSLSCSDQIFGMASAVDDAHFEQRDQDLYTVPLCLSADEHRIVCDYSTDCSAFDTCLFSYASSDGVNVTDSHVSLCSDWDFKTCCSLNFKPILTSGTLEATSSFNLSQDNLTISSSGVSDADGDTVRVIKDWRVNGESIAFLHVPMDTNTNYATLPPRDYSSFDNEITMSANPPRWVDDCVVGGCYEFNGTNYLSVPHTTDLVFSQDFTASVWLYADASDQLSWAGVFAKDVQNNFGSFALAFDNAGRVLRFGFRTGGTQIEVDTGSAIPKETWIHAVGVYKAGLSLSLYIDGSLVDSTPLSSSDIPNLNNRPFYIGSRTHSQSLFTGRVDEVYLFNRSLSPEQIQLMYQAGLAGEPWTTVVANETSSSETWSVALTPNDGWQDGETLLSNEVFIAAGDVEIEQEILFTNLTTSHSFLANAVASYSSGASSITDVTINSSIGSCSLFDTDVQGIFYNVTFSCEGTPYETANVNITFCDSADNCATTETAHNAFPNQAPTMNALLTPTDGNSSLIQRFVPFSWEAATDPEGDPINYTLNITNNFCQDHVITNISSTTFQDIALNTSFECNDQPYLWQVQACDPWDCGEFTLPFNFSIQDYLEITVLEDTVNFTMTEVFSDKNTTDATYAPFLFENTGNVFANLVGVTSTGLWDSVPLNTTYYQFKANNATIPGFNWFSSITDWLNVTATGDQGTIIQDLTYQEGQAVIDILIRVPSAEPVGTKTDTVTFVWEAS